MESRPGESLSAPRVLPGGLAACRCPRFAPDGPRCNAPATAEDMLCDACRGSVAEFTTTSIDRHVRIGPLRITLAGRTEGSAGTPSGLPDDLGTGR